MTKKCSRCKAEKPLSEFHRRASRAGGYAPACKSCKSVIAQKYRDGNLEAVRKRSLDWHNENRERSISNTKAWQARNREAYLAKGRADRAQNVEAARAAWRKWRDENRDMVRALRMKRYAALKNAIPGWANAESIRSVYTTALRLSRETGVRHDVDHIVPLQSPLVCGLHVEYNLRPLPMLENSSKGNRWWPDMPLAHTTAQSQAERLTCQRPFRKANKATQVT